MEEQKKTKVVNMNSTDKKESPKKLSYEQLNDACNQLWQQNRQLVKQNSELERFAINKRLDFLFKVLEFSSMFKSDFVISCTNEIEEAMTVTSEEEPKEE